MKQTLTVLSGFLGLLFFEGFARLIITFYHRMDFQFYGISHLPSDVWIVVILLSVITSTWLVTMLVLTVINKHFLFYAVVFGSIIIAWRGVEILNSYHTEPAWYFFTVVILHIIGIFLAYQSFTRQHEINSSI
ncbi:MAG: hypothetical protein MK198_01725 [Gracilimonas sp.]|uniref:hypothetical protein n=1 Tax=Gracilimonas sp. TaxID=1974203 RepID=UPI00375271C6|nr:hypothetical protein [Gracilimonas sp.]